MILGGLGAFRFKEELGLPFRAVALEPLFEGELVDGDLTTAGLAAQI